MESIGRRKNTKQLKLPFRADQIGTVAQMVRAAQSARRRSGWRGLPASPPGSFLDAVLSAFRTESSIPLEIPWSYVLSLISWRLVQSKSTVVIAGDAQELDLWLTVLGESGSGKTLTQQILNSALEIASDFGEPVSAAAWLQCLSDQNGRAHWVRDEWGQMFRLISDPRSPLGGVRD